MMRFVLILLFLLIPSLADAATGSAAVDTFYVRPAATCANNGDGMAYGCAASPGASGAWSGLTSIVWTATTGVDDGDTLYVCGTHPITLPIGSTAAGSASSYININFACPSDAGLIRNITAMPEALTGGNWTNESGSLWYLSVSTYTWKDPKRLWIDSVEKFPASIKAALGTQEGTSAPTAYFWYDSVNFRLYVYSAGNPATGPALFESLVGGSSTCAYTAICFNANANKYFNVIDTNLQGGNLATVYILGAEYISFTGSNVSDTACHIGGYGVWGMKITDTSVSGTGTASSHITVRDCTLDPLHPVTFTNMNWSTWGSTDGISLVNGTSYASITSNTLKNWGHVHINISATLGTLNTTDNAVSSNTLTCESFTNYCRGMAINGATAGRATRNVFSSNTIDGQTVHSELNGNGNTVSGNWWKNHRQGTNTQVFNSTLITQSLDMEGFTGVISTDNIISGNTFQDNTYAPCLSIRNGTNTKARLLITGNVLVNCGGAYSGYEQAGLVLENFASVGNTHTITNNRIYDTVQTNTVYYKATGLTTVAAFQAACSGDVCSGNYATAPVPPSSGPHPVVPRSPITQSRLPRL